MKKVVEIALGVMTALGGFLDIGELVFMAQAGAIFGYSLLWVVALSTIGIIVYSEMCGRIAAVAKQPVFESVKTRLGPKPTFVVWIASSLLNIATCAAEIGGVAVLIRLLTGLNQTVAIFGIAIALIGLIWVLPFKWIERVFGLAGLLILVFLAASLDVGVDWGEAASGLVPQIPRGDPVTLLRYGYFALGIVSSVMMPYEVWFYSSGGIEEGWKAKDIPLNRVVSISGMILGAFVAIAIVALGAEVLRGKGIVPDVLGTSALMVGTTYGRIGILFAIGGMIAAIAGAAVETSLAAAYNFAQFFGKKWGRAKPARETPAFDAAWIFVFVTAAIVVSTGIDPVQLVEGAVMLAVVCLPFTYLPILLSASDRKLMGKHANRTVTNVVGWAYFVIVCVAAVAAPIFMVITDMGRK